MLLTNTLKSEFQSKLTIGKFYYDKNIGKVVYDISFPEKQILVSKDTVLYHFIDGKLNNKTRAFNMAQFSIFNISLNNQLTNYGFEESFYSIDNVEKIQNILSLLTTDILPEKCLQFIFPHFTPGKVFLQHFF